MIAAELGHWDEATAEWDPGGALMGDPTRPRGAEALPPAPALLPCGCSSVDDRECAGHAVLSEAGRVCLCMCHEGLPEEA